VDREAIAFNMQVQAIKNAQASNDARKETRLILREIIEILDERGDERYLLNQVFKAWQAVSFDWPIR
jgi:hypothetical protein